MADIVGVSFPIGFHFGEEVSFVDALGLTDCALNCISPFAVYFAVVGTIKRLQTRGDIADRIILRCIRLIQGRYRFPLEIG